MMDRRDFVVGVSAGVAWLGCGGAAGRLEPARIDRELITRHRFPYCGEPRPRDLAGSWLTPTRRFYVLNHGTVPSIDPRRFRLRVGGRVKRELSLSIEALRREFPRVEVEATLMCAGNRRRAMNRVREVKGFPLWGPGAIGNARWAGAPLAAVLEKAGVADGARHLHLTGLDRVAQKTGAVAGFGGSLPVAALRRMPRPALLAYEMNGEPLSPHHGFPVRAVMPGMIGARSVKWLGSLSLERRPSTNPSFLVGHRLQSGPIYEFPVNGAICAPPELESGPATLRGYAIASGRDRIQRVELSTDGGERWQPATLVGPDRPGCWRLWRTRARLAPGDRVAVRAVTAAGARMPREARWNETGYLHNAWDRRRVS